jgi:serine protease
VDPGQDVRGREVRAGLLSLRPHISAALAATTVLAGLPGSAAAEPTGRILVSLRGTGAGAHASAAPVLAHASARRDGPVVPAIGLVTVRPLPGVRTADALRELRADPRVRAATRERRFTPRELPSDPALSTPDPAGPPGTTLQWPLLRENFGAAWDRFGGAGALVAVIDTGIDASHPDLAGKIAATLDFDAGAGSPATDQDGHGTHVASLACAATDNGLGIAGAGRDCKLLVLRTDFTESSVAAALVAAAQRGAGAVSLAFGGDRSTGPAFADALRYAAAHGAVPVAAAADEPTTGQGYPAALLQPAGTGPQLGSGLGLVVTAATGADRRASFAGYGTGISLAAYGALTASSTGVHGLLGLYPAAVTPRERGGPRSRPCHCRATLGGDDRYAFLAGTSMATPQVAAAAAMLRALNPALGTADVVRVLEETARRPSGAWSPDLGWGILDAGAAVEAARRIDRVAPTSRASAPRRVTGTRVWVRLRGTDAGREPLIGSGIRRFELWGKRGDGHARRLARTRARSLTLRARPGRLRLWSIAVDRAGNREPVPRRPDVRIRVSPR